MPSLLRPIIYDDYYLSTHNWLSNWPRRGKRDPGRLPQKQYNLTEDEIFFVTLDGTVNVTFLSDILHIEYNMSRDVCGTIQRFLPKMSSSFV